MRISLRRCIWVGDVVQPAYGLALGYRDMWGDLSETSRSLRSGAEFIDERPRFREVTLGLDALSDANKAAFFEMMRTVGTSKQMLFIKDPDSPAKETVLGRLQEPSTYRHRQETLHSTSMVIRESL